MPDIFTTKGDLAVATAADSACRLGVGADATLLTADSTCNLGVKWAASATVTTVPTNLIAFFNGAVASIPSGFAEFTAARGRIIVGVPAGGTVGGTVGSAMSDLEARSHSHTGPSHQHSESISTATADMRNATQVFGSGSTFSQTHKTAPSGATETPAADLTAAAGTGATGTASTGDVVATIQQPVMYKT